MLHTATGGTFWGAAIASVQQFDALYTKVLRKPSAKDLLALCRKIDKDPSLYSWVTRCCEPEVYSSVLLPGHRLVHQAVKEKTDDVEHLLRVLGEWKAAVEHVLGLAAPERFQYAGYPVLNPERICDTFCREALAGLDYLVALFRKRGAEKLLDKCFSEVVLDLAEDQGAAGMHEQTRVLFIHVPVLRQSKGRFIEAVNETLLHEFGHYIHLNYLKPDARRAWDRPWEELGVADKRTLAPYDQKSRAQRDERLSPLEIPTEYGKTNEKEDFAETFMLFMAAPERLTPTAKYRMQEALSLSGLYGKPVMRLSQHERIVRRFLAGVVLPFRPKPGVPTETIGGRRYVLSTDGGPLGDPDVPGTGIFEGMGGHMLDLPRPENKWRFLWVYDIEKKYVTMWRAPDGNEKESGADRHYGAKIVALEKKGQLNRVSHAEFLAIEREMRRREDDVLKALEQTLEESKDDYQLDVDRLATELYERQAVPKIKRAIADIQAGAVPIGFKEHGGPTPRDRQMVAYVIGEIVRRECSEERILAYIRHHGIDPDAPYHDIQAAYWAAGDMLERAYKMFLPDR